MTSFPRFIMTLVVVGVVINLSVVMLANAHSARAQEKGRQSELAIFRGIVQSVSERGRRAHVVVESQEVSWRGEVTRTVLLIRRHFLTGNGPGGESMGGGDSRLPLTRVVIDGDKLSMDGLLLEFGSNFHVESDGHEILRGMKLAYFARVHGAKGTQEDWFSFVGAPAVPQMTRIYPEEDQPTFFERQLWLHVWDLVGNSQWAATADLKAHYLPAATITVKNGRMYTSYLGVDGISLEEDANTPGLRTDILNEAASMKNLRTE